MSDHELICHHGIVLGLGPHSVVYEGTYEDRPVAVKKISTKSLKDREILESIRRLDHDNVVKILLDGNSTERENIYRCLVLELGVGTLDDVFKGYCDHLPIDKIPDHLQGLLHMARGLEHVHSKGLQHGAVKPGNILICKSVHSGVVLKLSQDSLSTITEAISFGALLSMEALKYWPPELLKLIDIDRIPRRPTVAADIFALGCIFYGYVTDGAHPFGKGLDILHNILEGKNHLAEITNHAAVEIIRQMIQTSTSSRPPMNKVLSAVEDLVNKPSKPHRFYSPNRTRIWNALEPVLRLPVIRKTKTPELQLSEEHARYIHGFRVNRCNDFYLHQQCLNKHCFNYHEPNQRRRRCFLKDDGTLNYEGNAVCPLYDKETGKCPRGDDCHLLHENVGSSERRFHLSNYKTELCNIPNCKHPHCSFAHGNSDLRLPVYNKQNKIVVRKRLDEMADDYKSMWSDPDCVISSYKTQKCDFPYESCPRRFYCHFYHNDRDRRRSLKKFAYWPHPCPHVYDTGKTEWKDKKCRYGDACRYCHNNREHQYHVLTYKTVLCLHFQSDGICPRGLLCAFAHSEDERRKPKQFQVDEMNIQELMAYLQLF